MNKFFVTTFYLSILSLIGCIDDQTRNKVTVFETELKHKEEWLNTEITSIAEFMDFKRSSTNIINRGVWYHASYVSTDFNKEKIYELQHYLVQKGWRDYTGVFDQNQYISSTASKSRKSAQHIKVLCKDKATIFIYTTDMQEEYKINLFEVRTLTTLEYSYTLPCYDIR